MKQKRILAGHKKIGKRFIPPMLQLKNIKPTSYTDNILPELIWIALITDKIGPHKSYQFLSNLCKFIHTIAPEIHSSFALISSYNKLNIEQKLSIHNYINHKYNLEEIQRILAPLMVLYPDAPLSFLGLPKNVPNTVDLVRTMEYVVGKVFGKSSIDGSILCGAILLSRMATNKIHFFKGLDIPDFNTIFIDPSSNESARVASFFRSNALAEFGHNPPPPDWAQYFWRKGIEFSECIISCDED